MKELLSVYLQSGLFGSVIIVFILLARYFLKQAPRKYLCGLWVLAAIRLLIPFHVESQFSLQPQYDQPSFAIQATDPEEYPNVMPEWTPIEPGLETDMDPAPENENSASAPVDYLQMLCVAWIAVGIGLMIYSAVSYGLLKSRVRDAVKFDGNILEADRIQGAFLLGYFKPRIYIPVGLSQRDRGFIVAHERVHLSRGDHWWKLIGFLCVCVHWYNPLVWIGYYYLCRDIEIACDEQVVRNMDLEQRKAYSFALLNCGKRLSGFMVCPVAFGEISLKQRIKMVLSYRRPGLWITVIAAVLVVFVAMCFLTTPVTDDSGQPGESAATEPTVSHVYDEGVVTKEPSCAEPGIRSYTCTVCGEVKTESIAVLSHAYDDGVEIHEPNCAEQGAVTYTCKVCGQTKTEGISTLNHTFAEQALTKAATCKEEGEITVTCTLCGFQQIVEKLPKTNTHTYENTVIRKPTCVDRGEGADICTLCGHSIPCDYELTDHTYGNAVVTKEATCTQKGQKTYTCSVCKVEYTKTIEKKDHIWDDGPCNAPGTCTVCGTTGSANRGHDYYLDADYPPSNMYPGQKSYRCNRCDGRYITYYNDWGEYDLANAVAAGIKRAKELGFGTAYSAPDNKDHLLCKSRKLAYYETTYGRSPAGQMKTEMVKLIDKVYETFPYDNYADYYVVATIELRLDEIRSPYFYMYAYVYSYD